MDIELRPGLLVREHSRDKPTLPGPNSRLLGQTFAPQAPSPRFFSYLGRAYPFGKLPQFG